MKFNWELRKKTYSFQFDIIKENKNQFSERKKKSKGKEDKTFAFALLENNE